MEFFNQNPGDQQNLNAMMDQNYNTDANESFSHTEIMSVHSGDD